MDKTVEIEGKALMSSVSTKKTMESTIASFSSIMNLIPDAVLVVDGESMIILANLQAHQMFGYQDGELLGQNIDMLVPQSKRSFHGGHVAKFFTQPSRRSMGSAMALLGSRKDKSEFPVDVMLGPMETITELLVMCVVRDVSEIQKNHEALKAALEREQCMARTDSLTGAANSRYFYDLLEREIARNRRYKHPFTVSYIDLDNFKQVNDLFGHSEGDAVLRSMIECIQQHIRKCDVIGRMGGDEFALLFPETDSAVAKSVLSKVQKTLLEDMKVNGWPVTFSIGTLTCRGGAETPDEVIRVADALMYEVKHNGKNAIKYSVYGSSV